MTRKNAGFTLVEVVMVLVLIGVLVAVAYPKFFDIRSRAQEQTFQSIAQAYQSRLNSAFAQGLLSDLSCSAARLQALAEADSMKASGYTISSVASRQVAIGQVRLTITAADGTVKIFVLSLPKCSTD